MRLICAGAALAALNACTPEEVSKESFSGDMVLAMSWQPAFCERRSRLRECRSQREGRFDTTNFSLHGLWPQPASNQYCGVEEDEIKRDKDRKWKRLKGLGLSDATKKALWDVMPGSQSYLHRHEWVKHGTCYSKSPETYYKDSLALMAAVNGSTVRDFFERSIGKSVTNQQIRAEFDKAFGKGVGERVRVSCKRDGDRTIIVELTLGLSGRISGEPDIANLSLASNPTKSGCPRGVVDPVGLQ